MDKKRNSGFGEVRSTAVQGSVFFTVFFFLGVVLGAEDFGSWFWQSVIATVFFLVIMRCIAIYHARRKVSKSKAR